MSEDDNAGAPAPRQDAGFEDSFTPARLAARDDEDLAVVSALLQDAVLTSHDLAFLPEARRFAFVANRYRWEEPEARERVRCGVHAEGVLSAKRKGFPTVAENAKAETPMAILGVLFEPGESAPGGQLRIAFAGGAEVLLEVDAIDVALKDIGKPWPAKAKPKHEE